MITDYSLYAYMEEMLRRIPTSFYRYMYGKIDWSSRMIGLVGPRGVGKSTMILQYISNHKDVGKHLYVSADNTYLLIANIGITLNKNKQSVIKVIER